MGDGFRNKECVEQTMGGEGLYGVGEISCDLTDARTASYVEGGFDVGVAFRS